MSEPFSGRMTESDWKGLKSISAEWIRIFTELKYPVWSLVQGALWLHDKGNV